MDRTVTSRLRAMALEQSNRGNHSRAEVLFEAVKQLEDYHSLVDQATKVRIAPRESNWGSDWVDDL